VKIVFPGENVTKRKTSRCHSDETYGRKNCEKGREVKRESSPNMPGYKKRENKAPGRGRVSPTRKKTVRRGVKKVPGGRSRFLREGERHRPKEGGSGEEETGTRKKKDLRERGGP